ncbi:hypothetical protein [Arthrobacter sp. ok362]|uniref:hypothetical protein n=1 Tax=Arthrobacter sp. ok362 TaxID=1761745 RepID=UPI0011145257|nr:hypothetical protein [Arthrobacter sp. ok362]
MVDTVITIGRQNLHANFRSIDDTPTGDLREISFPCHFSDDAINSGTLHGPPPSIRVQWWGTVSPADLRIELIPPGLPPERLLARMQRTLVPWTVERTGDETSGQSARPSSSRTSRRLVIDDPFEHDWGLGGELAPIDPGDGRPPGSGGGGGGGQSYTRTIDPRTDPVGSWTLRVRYFGVENTDLYFTIEYPHTIQVIEETRIAQRRPPTHVEVHL